MFRVHFAVFLTAMTFVLISFEVEGQSTIDDQSEICDNILPTSEQVANLIRHGVEKAIASIQQQSKENPVMTSKQALVSALECE